MLDRKSLKTSSKKILKKHYIILVILCFASSILGAEFSGSLLVTRMDKNIISEQYNHIKDIENKPIDEIKQEQKEEIKNIKENDNNKYLGKRKGVFSYLVNMYNTGGFFVIIISGLYSIFGSATIAKVLTIFLSIILVLIVWFFFINIFKVMTRRVALESLSYETVNKRRILYIIKSGYWFNVSKTMFLVTIYQFLWTFTIVGGIIKRYSYYLVPFILAENPSIGSLDAIKLSEDMMEGHKLELFKLELSFLLYDILGILTLGALEVLFVNPYKLITYTNYYKYIRKLSKEEEIVENIELLNDKYLYELPTDKEILKKYKDIKDIIKETKKGKLVLPTYKNIVTDYLGINILSTEQNKKYLEQKNKYNKIEYYKSVYNKKSYPIRLSNIKTKEDKEYIYHNSYLRAYPVTTLILIFFLLSFMGWIWEGSLSLINFGFFANRGYYYGPWLPIYGSGCVLILTLLYRFRKNGVVQFLMIVLLCGVVEYFTGFYLEYISGGNRWWDYNGVFMNLHGRICAEGLLAFGLGGTFLIYYIAPFVDDILLKVSRKIKIFLIIFLLIVFSIDVVYTSYYPNQGESEIMIEKR